MLSKLSKSMMLPFAAALVAITSVPVMAQNFQNWANNEQNQINQDAAAGVISPGEASRLANKEAQIQAQQAQYLQQNGGILTRGENQRISSELRNVRNRLKGDVSRSMANRGYVAPGYVAPGYVAPGYVAPGYVAPTYVPATAYNSGYNTNLNMHHHHHNSSGYGNGNGYWH